MELLAGGRVVRVSQYAILVLLDWEKTDIQAQRAS